jgi:N-acetylglucosamine-6-sulfatase
MRRATGIGVVALVVGSLTALATRDDGPGSAAAASDRFNVVLIVTDDQNANTIPTNPAPMPWLQARVADPTDRWTRFTTAVTNISLCCPARATLLTGQYGNHTGVETNKAAGQFRDSSTLATWLDGAGYYTGLVGKYLNAYPWNRGISWKPPGWDKWAAVDFNPGAERYYDYRLIADGAVETHGSAASDYLTDVLASKAVNFIDTAPTDQPFFLYFTPIAGHHPWTPAPRHVDALASMAPVRQPSFNEQNVSDKPAWVQALPLRSAAGIATVDNSRRHASETLLAADDAVRNIVEALQRRGALDNTVIVFVSDHGHAFGEHRWNSKRCEYEECNLVPLFIRHPAGGHDTRNDLVTNADIAPTIAAATGVTPTIAVDGLSLIPAVTGGQLPSRDGVLLSGVRTDNFTQPGYWGYRTSQYLYVELDTGEKELYDLAGVVGPPDPYQLENRAGQPLYAQVQSSLATKLAALHDAPPPPGATIDVSDSQATPTLLPVAQGTSVQWRFMGTRTQSIVDKTGLGLYDSGSRSPGETFSYTFSAAGWFRYTDALHPGVINGVVSVPIRTTPSSGARTTAYTVTWATATSAADYVYDVQVRRPGSTTFVDWRVGVSNPSASFTPDAGSGSYTFRARLRKPAVNKATGYSPFASIRVS